MDECHSDPVPVLWLLKQQQKMNFTLRWRHNRHNGVANHQPHHCLLNSLFGTGQRKHQSSASLAFVRGIHRWPVNSLHKWPVTQKMFPFDDVIMISEHDDVRTLTHFPRYWCFLWVQRSCNANFDGFFAGGLNKLNKSSGHSKESYWHSWEFTLNDQSCWLVLWCHHFL